MWVIQVGHARDRRQILDPQHVSDLERAHVEVDVLRNAHRQSLDVDVARHVGEHAAELQPRRLADERHGDQGLDGPVEAHLLQIDVGDRAADRVALVLLEDRRVHRRLAGEHDVEDRVEPRGTGERPAQVALGHDEWVRRLALAVRTPGIRPARRRQCRGPTARAP